MKRLIVILMLFCSAVVSAQAQQYDVCDSLYTVSYSRFMTARQYAMIGNYQKADELYSQCIEICSKLNDEDSLGTMCYAAMELAEVKAYVGRFEEAHDYLAMLVNYYGSHQLMETIDFVNLLCHAVTVLSLEEDYEESCNICKQALDIIPHIEDINPK